MLYYSVRTRQALRQRIQQLPLGLPHYSYGIVCEKFQPLFANLGIGVHELLMPEIYPSYRDIRPVFDSKGPPIHMIFKAFDELRVLKGAYNIAHVAWEYDRLPTFDSMPQLSPKRTHPLNDYQYALNLLDEIWVGCEFTKNTLERHGLSNVHCIPAPIDSLQELAASARNPAGDVSRSPLQVVEGSREALGNALGNDFPVTLGEGLFIRIAEAKRRGGKVFLSIFNPHDPRKNPGPMLMGFQRHVQKHRTADMLIIKILVDGKFNTLDDIFRVIFPRRLKETLASFELMDCENIVFVCGFLSDNEMDRLYKASDFYLCTSNAEGQNLPLLEAMARGGVPVSPATTAMADYVSESNAVVLQTTEYPVYDSVATAYGLNSARWSEVSAREVARGIAEAASLKKGVLDAKSKAAIQTVAAKYAPSVVASLVRARFQAISKKPRGREYQPASVSA